MNPIFSNRRPKVVPLFILLVIALFCLNIDYRYQFFKVFKKSFVMPRNYVFQVANFPFDLFRNTIKYFVLHNNLLQENIYLKQLNLLQATKLQLLSALEVENIRLKNLLLFSEQQKQMFSLAGVINVDPDPFIHQLILNKGMSHGVYVGQPIVNADGLLGSIVSVDYTTSVAMLLTDLNYAVPVVNLRTGFRTIVLGTGNTRELILQHAPHTADIKEQDIFVTSGIGGKYPYGYKVGIVKTVQHETNLPFATVTLSVETSLDNCHEVLLIYRDKDDIK